MRIRLTVLFGLLIVVPVLADRLDIGDPAPALSITHWLKGEAVDLAAVRGQKVVVLEFWATWCGPCISAMPHLTELQKKYADAGLIVIGVTRPDPNNSLEKVEQFVRDNPDKMGYTAAFDGDGATNEAYMRAASQKFIPCTFIIDREGKVAWIGHPMNMDGPLTRILSGKHDISLFQIQQLLTDRLNEQRQSQNFEGMSATLEAMIALEPDNGEAWRERIMLSANSLNKPQAAIEAAHRASKLAWDHPDRLASVAATIAMCRGVEGLTPLGVAAAKRVIELRPRESGMMYLTLVDVLAAGGQVDEALKTARDAVPILEQEQPTLLTSMVRTLIQTQFGTEGRKLAGEVATKALERNWNDATSMMLLTFALKSDPAADEATRALALKAARRMVELQPDNPRGPLNLIDTLIATGNTDEALRVAEASCELILKQDAFLISWFARSLSSPRMKGCGAALAVRAIDAALAQQPGAADLLEDKFRVQALALKNLSAARQTGEELLSKASNQAATLNSFAWALLTEDGLKGQFNDLALRAAVACHEASGGRNWAFLDTLALAKFETGSVQEAIDLERQALQIARKEGVSAAQLSELEAALKRFEQGRTTSREPEAK